MFVCPVCKQENEDEFNFCKNCGTLLEKPKSQSTPVPNAVAQPAKAPVQNLQSADTAPVKPEPLPTLVPVFMNLPDPNNPAIRTLQQVYVTEAQLNAMRKAGMFSVAE